MPPRLATPSKAAPRMHDTLTVRINIVRQAASWGRDTMTFAGTGRGEDGRIGVSVRGVR